MCGNDPSKLLEPRSLCKNEGYGQRRSQDHTKEVGKFIDVSYREVRTLLVKAGMDPEIWFDDRSLEKMRGVSNCDKPGKGRKGAYTKTRLLRDSKPLGMVPLKPNPWK